MSPESLINRLRHDALSVAYVASYLMIPNGAARKWLIDHGAQECRTTMPRTWRIPGSQRMAATSRAQDRWNARA